MSMINPYANVVQALRQLGYNVLTSYDAGQANRGIPDDQVLTFAQQQNRVVIILNRDDFLSPHRSGIQHSSLIICESDRDYFRQIQALHTYLQGDQCRAI